MQKDVEEFAHICEEELQAIRYFKIREIQKAWEDLSSIGIVPVLYVRHPDYMDYKSFDDSFREKFKITWGDNQIALAKINSEIEKMNSDEGLVIGIKLRGIRDDELDLFDKLLSLDYLPPEDWNDIALHLRLLIGYYSNGNMFIPSIEMRADLSMCKLIGAVNKLYGAARVEGETRLAGRKKQGKNVESSQTEVFSAFETLGIKNNPRYKYKSQVANAIKKYLISENKKLPLKERKKIPSNRTIIRHLESNEEIRNNLIKMKSD